VDWKTIELHAYTYYSIRGYRILYPLIDSSKYDFVAEKDGKFIRVNAKLAGLKDKGNKNSWSISLSSGSFKYGEDSTGVDVYLTWLPHKQKFIEIDGDFFKSTKSKSRVIPKNLREDK